VVYVTKNVYDILTNSMHNELSGKQVNMK